MYYKTLGYRNAQKMDRDGQITNTPAYYIICPLSMLSLCMENGQKASVFVQASKVTDNKKDTSLLKNMSIFHS